MMALVFISEVMSGYTAVIYRFELSGHQKEIILSRFDNYPPMTYLIVVAGCNQVKIALTLSAAQLSSSCPDRRRSRPHADVAVLRV